MTFKAETSTKRATIRDVAKRANVSIKTVSRVIRREPHVSEETRLAVEQAVRELNYRPVPSARNSTSDRSFLIGLIFDNPNPSYTSDLIHAAIVTARDNGFHMLIEPIDRKALHPERQVQQLIVQSNLAGILLPPPLSDDADILNAIAELGTPVARIGSHTDPLFGVTSSTDDEAAVKSMIQHLIQLGHRRIGFITGRKGTPTTRARLDGYKKALSEAGIAVTESLIRPGDYLFKSGFNAGEFLLNIGEPPTAIFASNDDMAAGVLFAAQKCGLKVPDDLSVAGFDDSLIATSVWPALTTIRQPVRALVAQAINQLIFSIRLPESDLQVKASIACELIVRESTAAPRTSPRLA
jgi:LacI family transcriptional regulator